MLSALIKMYNLVVVIPTHNEERFIGEALDGVNKAVSKLFSKYIIAVADAVSVDSTRDIVERAAAKNSNIKLVKYPKVGRVGHDIMHTMLKYKANLYFYLDVDLLPSLKHLGVALKMEKCGCDLVIGTRYAPSSRTTRPRLRYVASKIYNKLGNLLWNEKITDHGCGFRIFDGEAFEIIAKSSREEHWAWDKEILLIARENGFKICEVPILWVERRSGRTPIKRLAGDTVYEGLTLLRLFWRFRISNWS